MPDTADMGEEGDKSTSSSWQGLVKDLQPEDKDQIVQEVGAAKMKREDAATEDKRCKTRVAAQDAAAGREHNGDSDCTGSWPKDELALEFKAASRLITRGAS